MYFKIVVVFHFPKNLRSSSICQQIEIVFQFGSYFTPERILGENSLKSSKILIPPGGDFQFLKVTLGGPCQLRCL
jgi:hypothetical protein